MGTCYTEDTLGKSELDAGIFLLDNFIYVQSYLILTIHVVTNCNYDIVNSRSLFVVAALKI